MAKTRDTANLVAQNNIYVDIVNDYVGIGSLTPTTKLDVSGGVNATFYYGDASQLSGLPSFQFNTGITSSLTFNITGIGTTVFTFPSTANKKYIVNSINCTNIAIGYTEVNVIASYMPNGGEENFIAYNVPISGNNSIELLKQPQIFNPSDAIRMRSTDFSRVGVSSAVQVYMVYQELTDTFQKYQGVGLGSIGLGVTSRTVLYTSTSFPTVVQSIRLVNRTDSGDYPVSVNIVSTSGIRSTFLTKDLIIPKYATVEICEQPKRIETGDTIGIILGQGATIDVQLSGRKTS
jgi:hypothetical protein